MISPMAQVTVYLPQEQPVCMARWSGSPGSVSEWPKSLVDLLRHGSADLIEPEDLPPEDVETFR